jgi:hypothetical protein
MPSTLSPPDHDETGDDHQCSADEHENLRDLAEDEEADQKGPDEGRVVERSDERDRRVPVARRQEGLAQATHDAGRDEEKRLLRGRRHPVEEAGDEPCERGDAGKVEHDRAHALILGQASHLERSEGGKACRSNRDAGAERLPPAGQGAGAEIGGQHDAHADEAQDERAPPVEAHLLLQDQHRQQGREQRRDVADGRGVGDGEVAQREEAAEQPAGAEQAAAHVGPEIAREDPVRQLSFPGEPDHQRHEREERTKEHDLTGRDRVRHRLHESLHDEKAMVEASLREIPRRGFKTNGPGEVRQRTTAYRGMPAITWSTGRPVCACLRRRAQASVGGSGRRSLQRP